MRARTEHLATLRSNIVPSKRIFVQSLRNFIEVESHLPMGATICERVFYRADYAVKPRDYHSWQPSKKQTYDASRKHYHVRITQLPLLSYEQLRTPEQEDVKRAALHNQLWIDLVESQMRDIEVAYGTPHPESPAGVLPAQFSVAIPLRSKFDLELERRRVPTLPTHLRNQLPSCTSCESNEYIISSLDGYVCTKEGCGRIITGSTGFIDETVSGLPFDADMRGESRGVYEVSENFMKNLDLIEATPNSKVPDEVKLYVRDNMNGRPVSINLIRRILKQGGHQRFYPAAPVIYEFITGKKIEKSTPDERALIHRMHVQYMTSFRRCPQEVRRRKSSLTNNYVNYKIYQMIGLNHRTAYIRMLKCEKKLAEHDRVFRWIVEDVRATSERDNVANGTSYWAWYPTLV